MSDRVLCILVRVLYHFRCGGVHVQERIMQQLVSLSPTPSISPLHTLCSQRENARACSLSRSRARFLSLSVARSLAYSTNHSLWRVRARARALSPLSLYSPSLTLHAYSCVRSFYTETYEYRERERERERERDCTHTHTHHQVKVVSTSRSFHI